MAQGRKLGSSRTITKKTGLESKAIFKSSLTSQTLSVIKIMPDPAQAREILPPDLKTRLVGGELPLAILEEFMTQQPDSIALNRIIELAKTIQRDGLITPISVRPVEESGYTDLPSHITHVITTGERRWWAHVYLLATNQKIQVGTRQIEADSIAAVPTAKGASVVSQQLIENFQREDLNAVEKAMGLDQLKQEIQQENGGKATWEQVYERVGIQKRYGIYVRKVLTLSPDALSLISAHGFKESSIRPIIKRLEKFPKLQLRALEHLARIQSLKEGEPELISLNAFIEQLLGTDAPAPVRKPKTAKPLNIRSFQKGIGKTINELEMIDLLSLRSDNRDELVSELERLIKITQEKLKDL